MSWTSILFIITLIINVVILYLLRNSHEYNCEEPIKFPLFIYLLEIIILFIPILNVIVTIVLTFMIIAAYIESDIEFNKDFWLAKKY
jgi:heme/copper-type cytochrome/quinol oxidase subunit 2